MITRRALSLLGLAPGVALAQARLPRLVCLSAASAEDPVAFILLRRYLSALGWRDGATIAIEERHGNGRADILPRLAAELMALRPDVIVVTGSTEATTFRNMTGTTPIVFLQVVEPVALGLVASFARPGGNVTGAAASGQLLWAKRLEILKDLLPPGRGRLAVITNSGNVAQARKLADIAEHAPRMGFTPAVIPVPDPTALEPALVLAAGYDALLVPHDFVLFPRRRRIVTFAREAGLPAVYENRFSTIIGGMASYGADLRDNFRQGALYVDRILRGARPADLPVVQPSRVELVLHAGAIAALGLEAPAALLARADEVIE